MSARSRDQRVEVGPLGPGSVPIKDPLKGLRGVVSGMLILEAITIFLALTVVLKVDSGALWTPFNIAFIVALGFAHVVLAFLQRFSWGMKAAIALQFVGIIGGILVHWSVTAIMVIFGLVWWYMLFLRANLIERMKRGLLTTQHLGTGEERR
ncbi:DUF4233 domain-containing protein [Corynebacterium tapiri]|uniref:DUF4233 domain-containing protein n=1 Tax=Corynebacterium tapiri TaxID=1448266 RepID=A0A5C4U3M2_9CORY|nr:DUF4233 domain-containing protein [Corynebacterium tapiri]TNL96652.1 DUF4233 domain-containing protein [Corynebacterium tapiri]